MTGWQQYLEDLFPTELATSEVESPLARATAALLRSGKYAAAQLISSRGGNASGPDRNLLIIDIDVGLGQRPVVNDIKATERVGITFIRRDSLPSVFPVRHDFPPNVPHLNLAPAGHPRSLCLFEMPVDEALRITTPYVLLERVSLWLKETAYGRLHGEDQPLEPIFFDSGDVVVLPSYDSATGPIGLFNAYRVSNHRGHPVFLEPSPPTARRSATYAGMSAVMLVTKALPHARIRVLPMNMAELLACYTELGIDLLTELRAAFQQWNANPAFSVHFKLPCLLIIRTPIERSPGRIGGEAAKAFLTLNTAQELALKVGALWKEGEHLGIPLSTHPVNMAELEIVSLQPLDIRRPFSRSIAQAASGLSPDSRFTRRIVLIGAGAVGSTFALTAARMGIGEWTIVDPDHLMPHNLARHALTADRVGSAKADAVAAEIQALLGEGAAVSIVASVSDPAALKAISEADLTIDGSASVPVARSLADRTFYSRPTISIFLNPSGTDLVILSEGEKRIPRLDYVEMTYYWKLINEDGLDAHLTNRGGATYPSGGCRQPSVQISEAQVGTLASIAAKRVLQDDPGSVSAIEIWRTSCNGIAVSRFSAPPYREVTIDGWKVSISEEVAESIITARTTAGSSETGGILIGAWDRGREHAYIVGNYPPPPDSVASQTGFVRGSMGVYKTLQAVEVSTASNLTYVGEWHTHPPGHSSRPSSDDGVLLRWIGEVLMFLDVPPLMMIAGHDGLRVLMGPKGQSALLD